ncbi:porin [Caenimonas soli]|uniref:porin n=1 Tax=Caenimonas soli TaxID=2735555 RepID=UPI0015574775|nr:porin [Caenimonas soli]NPC55605.1 porin [Caenimonas soli]
MHSFRQHSLFCVAAATLAYSGGTLAQSSVTLFGIVDAAYAHGSGSTASRNQLTSGSNASSRVGFRGTEDLGGGLSASFWLEAQFNTDNGTGLATNTNNQTSGTGTAAAGTQGLNFNRRSTVSLAGPWGELRLGRDYTGHYRNRVDTDPFSVVGVGATQVNVGTLAGQTSTRASNAIGYFTPAELGGFFGQAQYYLGENPSGTPTERDGSGYSLRAGYKGGPLTVSGAYAETRMASGDIVSTNVGAIFDTGSARLMGAIFRDKTESPIAVTGKGYTLGAVVLAGPGEIKVAVSRYGSDAGAQPHSRKIALGYVHNLSKRTALYATYARVGNSGGATTALNGSTTAANDRSTGYDLGVRHSF